MSEKVIVVLTIEELDLIEAIEDLKLIDKCVELNKEPTHEDMLEEAARRESENKALESLGIDRETFGQKPWDEDDLEPIPPKDFIKDYPEVTRVEVITNNGREYVNWDCSDVKVTIQDEGRTLKVFLS